MISTDTSPSTAWSSATNLITNLDNRASKNTLYPMIAVNSGVATY